MKTLLKYEIQKILMKRLTVVAIIAILLVSAIFSFSSYINMYAYDGVNKEGTGKTAVEIEKAVAQKYEGILTDSKVQQMMSDFKPKSDLNGLSAKYCYYNSIQATAFEHFSDNDGNWNGLSVSDVFGDEEIKIGYVNGWLSTSQNLITVLIFLPFILILLIAPVFSGEYGGVDNIILSTKHGKTKCTVAKIIASLIVSVFVTFLTVAFHLTIGFILYGTNGLDCSILFAPDVYLPYNISFGTMIKYQILLAFMSAVNVTGITLVLSALCKNQLISFVASIAVYVAPVLFPVSEVSELYKIYVLLPFPTSMFTPIMSVVQFQNGIFYGVLSIPVALLILTVGAIASSRIFAKHQVS